MYYYTVVTSWGTLWAYGFGMTFEMAEDQAMFAAKRYTNGHWDRKCEIKIRLERNGSFTQWSKEVR